MAESPFWFQLGQAFCLMLVLEGILPFLYPHRWRRMVRMLSETDDHSMRMMGLFSMLTGTALLLLMN